VTFPAEQPTNPGTPAARTAAAEVAATAAEIRFGSVKASIPVAMVVAVITSIASFGAVRMSAPAQTEANAALIETVRSDLREVKASQAAIFDKLVKDSAAHATSESLEQIQRAALMARMAAIESRVR